MESTARARIPYNNTSPTKNTKNTVKGMETLSGKMGVTPKVKCRNVPSKANHADICGILKGAVKPLRRRGIPSDILFLL
eukprot:scaffold34638_cov161-Amphora_coffeaeformis.AAC.8